MYVDCNSVTDFFNFVSVEWTFDDLLQRSWKKRKKNVNPLCGQMGFTAIYF